MFVIKLLHADSIIESYTYEVCSTLDHIALNVEFRHEDHFKIWLKVWFT